jgi:ABC-type transporter Mla subunit MlaD
MLAKKINTKHKQMLTDLTGSKRFLHVGTCQFQEGKFAFAMEKPVSGLARKLQDSIKNFTGKKLPLKVGTETAEADEEQEAASSTAQTAAPRAIPPALAKAPEAWHDARKNIETSINQLKTAIRNEFAKEAPALIADIEKNMSKLDAVLDKLDRRLADSLDKARSAKDAAARSAELKNSKNLLADYIKYVKAEPMIAHIDSNPFGVKTNLKQTLTTSLTQMAQAIG